MDVPMNGSSGKITLVIAPGPMRTLRRILPKPDPQSDAKSASGQKQQQNQQPQNITVSCGGQQLLVKRPADTPELVDSDGRPSSPGRQSGQPPAKRPMTKPYSFNAKPFSHNTKPLSIIQPKMPGIISTCIVRPLPQDANMSLAADATTVRITASQVISNAGNGPWKIILPPESAPQLTATKDSSEKKSAPAPPRLLEKHLTAQNVSASIDHPPPAAFQGAPPAPPPLKKNVLVSQQMAAMRQEEVKKEEIPLQSAGDVTVKQEPSRESSQVPTTPTMDTNLILVDRIEYETLRKDVMSKAITIDTLQGRIQKCMWEVNRSKKLIDELQRKLAEFQNGGSGVAGDSTTTNVQDSSSKSTPVQNTACKQEKD